MTLPGAVIINLSAVTTILLLSPVLSVSAPPASGSAKPEPEDVAEAMVNCRLSLSVTSVLNVT